MSSFPLLSCPHRDEDDSSEILRFRQALASAPVQVRHGFNLKASRELLMALAPSIDQRKIDPHHTPIPVLAYPVIDQVVPTLRRCLCDGADPCVRVTAPQGHFMPLSVATSLGLIDAVEVLLEAGAWTAWPDPDIETLALTGEADGVYEGILPDPLSEAARTLSGVATELDMKNTVDTLTRIAQKLSAHASPWASDPATGRTPVEELINGLEGWDSALSHDSREQLAQLLWDWLVPATPDSGIAELAKGSPHLAETATTVPTVLMPALQSRARQHMLNLTLSKTSKPKRAAARL